jgi:hypothetical protein
VFNGRELPSLWDPEQLFLHLAVWAGVPIAVMAAVAALLGFYQAVMSWLGLGKSTLQAARAAGSRVRSRTPPQVRAILRFLVCSVLAVAASYMIAVIVSAVTEMIAADPNGFFSLKDVADTVGVAPWPSAAVWTVTVEVIGIGLLGIACIGDLRRVQKLVTSLGGVIWLVAWLAGGYLAVVAGIMGLAHLLMGANPQPGADDPPWSLVILCMVTGLLGVLVGRLLPIISKASTEAFAPRERPV